MENIIDRRVFFKIAATGVTGYFVSPMEMFSQSAVTYWDPNPTIMKTAKNCIFILLAGAPSQTDTFDLHVGPWTPPDFGPTTINGADWPVGLLPNLGIQFLFNRCSLIRSCQTTALVHPLLQNWAQIARNPTGVTGKIAPNIGSIVALETESQRGAGQRLPGFLSLNGGGSLAGPGYFSGKYAPFDVTPNINGLTNLGNFDNQTLFTQRYNMLQAADGQLRNVPSPYGTKVEEMADFYSSARNIMYDPVTTNAFRFAASDQTKYGNNAFGNACLTARNVLWSNIGTRYVQITLGGWDNHQHLRDERRNLSVSTPVGRRRGESHCGPHGHSKQRRKDPVRRYAHCCEGRVRPYGRKHYGSARTRSLFRPFGVGCRWRNPGRASHW
jgi:hypothetical protein